MSADKAPGHWTGGKGDGSFDLVEAGPAPFGETQRVVLDSRVPAYRIESFGGTRVSIDLTSGDADTYLVVEGPLDDHGDRTAVGTGTVIGEDDDGGPGTDAHLDLTLDAPGVYRVLTGTYESLGEGDAPSGELALSVACSDHCIRAQVDQKAFVRGLLAQHADLAGYAKAELAQLVQDPATAQQLGDELDGILADPDLTGLERFPTLPLSGLADVRPALGLIPSSTPDPDAVVTGDLEQLLGACEPDRALPAEASAELPGVRYGQFPSDTLSPCQFAHADKLAHVLTSLAADNGSSITFRGETITTPRQLFIALVDSGHTVQVRNERMYANFLSFIVGDADLIWPVWLDTGLQLSSGDSFTIPVGHSQHAWRISGPVVNTRVTFFLGISGAGFFGQTDARPAWSGMSTSSDVTITSNNDDSYGYLLDTLDAASEYLRRNRVERSTVAAGYPADGYGYVGVCNDSNTTVEYATRGTISAFPLLRARSLDGEADLGDGLDDAVRALPKDADGLPDRADALRRAVLMQPFPDGSPLMFDAELGRQIATARRDVGE